jgi:hypothetical protein
VKHTISANGIRQGHTRALVPSQRHIGLAVGFVVVVCLTVFGGGVMVGIWYKVSEQIAPSGATVTSSTPETSSQSREATSQPQEPVTFYNMLTNSNVAYAPLTLPPTPAPSGAAAGTKAAAGAHPTKVTPAGGTTRTAAANVSHKQTKATPVPKATPVVATVPPASARVAAHKPVAPTRQPERDIVRVPAAPVSEQGVRYRMATDHTAHHLTAQEQVPAIVVGKD